MPNRSLLSQQFTVCICRAKWQNIFSQMFRMSSFMFCRKFTGYRFWMKWGWTNDYRIFFFFLWSSCPFMRQSKRLHAWSMHGPIHPIRFICISLYSPQRWRLFHHWDTDSIYLTGEEKHYRLVELMEYTHGRVQRAEIFVFRHWFKIAIERKGSRTLEFSSKH